LDRTPTNRWQIHVTSGKTSLSNPDKLMLAPYFFYDVSILDKFSSSTIKNTCHRTRQHEFSLLASSRRKIWKAPTTI